ncbi:cyclase family protein [Algicola sagamiensis]|uniref:cyclase family protein n=1 Tax=Algicola sagamiensis TaxID=163869 RepID=UPI00035DF14D|nr:cyclase family protein [Algicola sagamiensis]
MPMTIQDLSVPFSIGMPKYDAPWFPNFDVAEIKPAQMPDADWKRRFTKLDLFAHNGTHVETSDHVFRDGKTIDGYQLTQFVGHPFVLNLRHLPDATPIQPDMIESQLANYDGEKQPILLINTGYNDRAWGSETFWTNSPYLTPEAAALIASKKPNFIGIDFQTEKPREKSFVVHKTLLSSCELLCEYLFNLDKLNRESLFVALPISIENVEAAPVRAVGINF